MTVDELAETLLRIEAKLDLLLDLWYEPEADSVRTLDDAAAEDPPADWL